MGQPLEWGRRYLMVRPDHFRIDYVINPYMSPQEQPDPALALKQWDSLRQAIVDAGGEVEVLAQRADSPDMVYAMNLGLATADGRAMLSHMRFEPRRKESLTAAEWFTGHAFTLSRTGSDGIGPHFESGDAFVFGDSLVVGYGPRTEAEALKHVATEWNVRVRGLRIAHEAVDDGLAHAPVLVAEELEHQRQIAAVGGVRHQIGGFLARVGIVRARLFDELGVCVHRLLPSP